MNSDLIENGRITGADIAFYNGFALDCSLTLEFDGSGQSFGGWVLGGNPFDTSAVCARHEKQRNLAADFIGGVMVIADVEKFSQLTGKVIRVRRDVAFGPIIAIGHAFKDRWYEPSVRMKLLANSTGADLEEVQ